MIVPTGENRGFSMDITAYASKEAGKSAYAKFTVQCDLAGPVRESLTNPAFFNGRAIMTPTNEAVMKINDNLLERLPGEVLTFHADDTGDINDGGHEEMTREVMATMNCETLPLSVLRLKIGAPVMLLRNLEPVHGLCRASTQCLEVRLNDGSFDGEKRLICRTKLTSNEEDFPFS